MSVKALRKALKNKVVDEFEVGAVIRWTSSGRYVYTAVKSPIGWFTSAAEYNRYVPQIVDFDTLVEILARAETSNVEVASSWEPITG